MGNGFVKPPVFYYCPECGENVWAFSGFEGNTCWQCKFSKPLSNKGSWFKLMTHAHSLSNGQTLQDYYINQDQIVCYIGPSSIVFKNVIKKSQWQKVWTYNIIQQSYVCGLNAINLGLKIWGYQKQLELQEYSYKYFLNQKWGMSGSDFYEHNIKPVFNYHGYKYYQTICGIGMQFNWSYLDNNDYTLDSIIGMGGYGLGAHYFLILSVDTTKNYYLITDQSRKIWITPVKVMRTACIYQNNGYSQHSLYKIG